MRAPRVPGGRLARPLFAVMVALISLAALSATCQKSEEPEELLPPLTPFDAALSEQLHEIRDKAAEVRGLPVNGQIEEGWFTEEALADYSEESVESFSEDILEQIEAANITLRLLGLIEPDDDLLDIYASSEGIAGLYYPYLNKLALVFGGEKITPDNELTLAHEYVHSFQDGLWDIGELDKLIERDAEESSSSEFATTVRCLVEGDATFAMFSYAEEVYGPDWIVDVYGDVEEPPEPEPDEELPRALQFYFSFNYSACPFFVAAIYAEGGWEAVDDLYDDVPRSTEAILHPDRYLADKDIGSLVPLAELQEEMEGWERLSLLPFGEFDIFVYLAAHLEDEATALTASTGWDGGRSAVYTRTPEDGEDEEAAGEPATLLHVGVAFDTDADLKEFLSAFKKVRKLIATDEESGENGVTWSEESAFGEAWWDPEFRRFDMLIGDDLEAVSTGAAAAGAPRP